MKGEYDEIIVIQGVLKGEIHKIINNLKNENRSITETAFPPIDIVETKEKIKLYAEIPGVPLEDINLYLCGDLLIIEGEKKLEKIPYKVNFIRTERIATHFRRIIQLPCKIQESNIVAKLKDGILHVEFNKYSGG
jgi:HSP20 family protein